jgi:Icc-related predicted phosphoesterase
MDKGEEFLNQLDPTGVDVLVLAGDILSAIDRHSIKSVLEVFSKKYPHIIYVNGNHEMYGTVPSHAEGLIQKVTTSLGNVHYLNNSHVTIDGQRFIGGTGWFPYSPFADSAKHLMNDFKMIIGSQMLETDIVVSHHLPSNQCVARKFLLSAINPFFLGDFDDLILDKKPKLWIHGHTHGQVDLKIGPTRVIANPLGYYFEGQAQKAFQERLLIEV